MRTSLVAAIACLVVSCGGSSATIGSDSGSDAGTDAPVSESSIPHAPAEAAPPPTCDPLAPCIQVDATQKKHTISPLIFGDWIQWVDDGQGFWDPQANAIRSAWITALSPLGLTILRYPGGTLSDFFHWGQAVGPAAMRVPQENANASQPGQTQLPLFGPDEFAATASMLHTQMLITANVGTGTASEAAAWLTHYKQAGMVPGYWEIGNEVYITPSSWSSMQQLKTPAQYAAIFDAYAQALRAVDPNVKVGMLGCHDSGAFNLCADPSWNKTVLGTITQPADFISVHNSYAPAALYQTDGAAAMRATLAAPDYVQKNFALLESDIAQYGKGANAKVPIAITEHASFFVPSGRSTDLAWLQMNETIAAAVFSAAEYDLFMSDPQIQITNHVNPIGAVWQTMLTTSLSDGFSSPTMSAFGYVFQLYAQAAGAAFVPATIQGSPTFDATQVGLVPALSGVAMLHGIAALAPTGDRLWLYVANRDLTTDVTAQVIASGLPWGAVTSVTSELVNGPSWQSFNEPGTGSPVTLSTTMLTPAASMSITFPAHSVTRLMFR